MKHKLYILLACIGLIWGFSPSAAAQNPDNFRFSSFEADYYLSRNEARTSILKVEERLVAEFPDFDQNHGIIRAIPDTYLGRTLSLSVLSVTDEQKRPLPYEISQSNDNTLIKIGDANKYVRGQNIYLITYEYRNVINFQELDEFYWDVNGDEWRQPFGRVSARIHIPADLAPKLQDEKGCFTGVFGSKDTRCTMATVLSEDGSLLITVAAQQELLMYQGLSFVLGFEPGTFALGPEIAAAQRKQQILLLIVAASFATPIILTLAYVIRAYHRHGKDPKGKGVIVAEYAPPKGFTALKAEALLKEYVSGKGMTATLLELATKHIVTIHEIKMVKRFQKDTTVYELELMQSLTGLEAEHVTFLTAIFGNDPQPGQKKSLTELKNKLYSTVTKLSEDTLHELYLEGYFRTDPKDIKKRYLKIGGIMIGLSIAAGFLLLSIPFSIGLFISGIIVMISSSSMPSKSGQGVVAMEHIKGLQQYMELAEAERINFLQGLDTAERTQVTPADAAQKIILFEKLLPYALLFGIEKQWVSEFANLYTQPPDWYAGSQQFNAAYLLGSINAVSAASTQAFSAPSSSSSSGFGGGGFSGGGGGGGGGGGW